MTDSNTANSSIMTGDDDYAEMLVKRPTEAVPPADRAYVDPENQRALESHCAPLHNIKSPADKSTEEMRQCPNPGCEIDSLVPQDLGSSEKLLKIQDNSHLVFSGKFDAATVCGLLGTLDEADLRALREHLHAALPEAIPATAGRQLARRNAGSSVRLVEDCWALGYSAVNGVLTSRAHSSTLRPVGRSPLEPLPPPSSGTSAITSSMEALVASHLRLEGAYSGQQRDIARLRAEMAQLRGSREEPADLQGLRDNVAELRAAVADRDSRIAHLEEQMTELLSPIGTASSRQPVSQASRPHIASEVAGLIDVQELGASIAAALRAGAGDSDSDASDDPVWPSRAAGGARRRKAPAHRVRVPVKYKTDGAPKTRSWAETAAIHPTPDVMTAAPAARREESRVFPAAATSERRPPVVTGAGPRSAIVATDAEAAATLPFLLEGVSPEVADARVWNLVQELTTSLHNFQRVRRHSGAKQGLKAFRFDVDAADGAVVMNPASWPRGLRVRPWTAQPVSQQRTPAKAPGRDWTSDSRRQQPNSTVTSDRRLGAAQAALLRPLSPAEGTTSGRPGLAQRSGITGSGPASDLVATGTQGTSSSTAAFLIDGIHPEASSAQVRNLVWPLVSNLHQCHETRRGGVQAGAKAYRIVVDAEDGAAVLTPANWPAGLRVRAWSRQASQPF